MNFNVTILGQAISFIFFVLFCMKFIWPPVISVIENRQKDISTALKTAEKIKLDLEVTNNLVRKKIDEAKSKAMTIIKEANINKIMILEKAELEAEKKRDMIISEAYSNIEVERNQVLKELKKEVSILAIMMAEKIIKHQLSNNKIVLNIDSSLDSVVD